ncbi:MAG: NAD(+) diphosphatase [Oscillospiraceae bacterium]|nr:NAD(+) diphosphatase [Oscillospiraceae bacterium]
MIQDIYPSKLNNAFQNCKCSSEDILLHFDEEGKILSRIKDNLLYFPRGAEGNDSVYLFSVDNQKYFLAMHCEMQAEDGYAYHTVREIRDNASGKEVYAVFTAYHLWKWYCDNRYCGKCGSGMQHDAKERALQCSACCHRIYPRINPAVIVGVMNGDSLLITRYRKGYAHNALVAGFTEIGETLEETVQREVMEETGVRVRNIRYYKSQPWGMAQDILMGFFCEAEENSEIHMDQNELKYAEWVKREDIILQPNNMSLTNEMMKMFRDHQISAAE